MNHLSALQHRDFVTAKLAQEVAAGRIAGPDHRLLGMSWQGKFYFDRCLPMGRSTSCRTFEHFAQALQWILATKFRVPYLSHILDDFIFSAPRTTVCNLGLQSFLALATSLHIPVNAKKTLPSSVISLHGIEVDTVAMQSRLPHMISWL